METTDRRIRIGDYFVVAKTEIHVGYLFGAYFGVMVFAAVFEISAGMAVNTVVGVLRARSIPTAPDAKSEGFKPVIWGLAVPLMVFLGAVIVYVQVVMPALCKVVQG